MVHMHEKIEFVQSVTVPVFYTVYPGIYAGVVCFVQVIGHKADKGFGDGKLHMAYIAAAGRIRYNRTHL